MSERHSLGANLTHMPVQTVAGSSTYGQTKSMLLPTFCLTEILQLHPFQIQIYSFVQSKVWFENFINTDSDLHHTTLNILPTTFFHSVRTYCSHPMHNPFIQCDIHQRNPSRLLKGDSSSIPATLPNHSSTTLSQTLIHLCVFKQRCTVA